MRACPLAAHSISGAAIELLIQQHPGEGRAMTPRARKRKVAEFMAARYGIEQPLGPEPQSSSSHDASAWFDPPSARST